MSQLVHRLARRGAILLGCASTLLWASPAWAQSDLKLFESGNFEFNGDVRLVAVDGHKSWVDGGFGKLRSGSDGSLAVQPQLGNVNLVWKPQFTWSVGAIVVGAVEGGQRTEAGLSQAYITFRPMRSSSFAFSGRAGLMWPPVSLEHEGADWHVKDSITPSAINSWIGEEVRPVAAEASFAFQIGDHKLRATAALMAANDTSGTLLTFRGWALHDRTTLAFNRQPLPPLDPDIADYQAPYTHPLMDISGGFARHPGYYVKLAWAPPVPVRFELFRYDNEADPNSVNSDHEWGWHTSFEEAAVAAELGSGAELKAQALSGRTLMGHIEDGLRSVHSRFRSAFVLLTRPFGPIGLAGRVDVFDTRNDGSDATSEYDEHGWSAMIAAKHEWTHFTGLVEFLHVWSRRNELQATSLSEKQPQNQLQAEVRMHW
ncbi:MAG TPA: hypothetical protein VJ846_11620 [Sphingomicrobium sp.]|nr:hypothetical protein [Sphingomicrobium sp.]